MNINECKYDYYFSLEVMNTYIEKKMSLDWESNPGSITTGI